MRLPRTLLKRSYSSLLIILFLPLLMTGNIPSALAATPGSLDTSFNGSGVVATHLGANAIPFGVAVQSDGKIVTGGYESISGTWAFALARYTSGGALDATFGPYANGTTHTIIGKYGAYYFAFTETVNGLALQSDGKIIVAGYAVDFAGFIRFALARYTSSGVLDTTFGPYVNGTVTTKLYGQCDYTIGLGVAVALQNDGKIVVGGAYGAPTCANGGFAMLRYTPSGSLDTTFGPYSNGTVLTQIGTYYGWPHAIAIQGDGKIILAGDTYSITGAHKIALARYSSGGILDTTFGPNSNGTLTTLIGTDSEAYALGLQSDGKIVVGGTASIMGTANFVVARYTSSGVLDAGFGSSGYTTTTLGSGAFSYSLAIQANGKIILGGNAFVPDGLDLVLARYTSSGALDAGFGSAGIVTTHLANAAVANGIAIQSDGNIVVVGQIDAPNHLFGVARYLGDSTILPTITFKTSTGSGSINFNGTSYTNGQSGNYTIGNDTISASAPAGYKFASWSTTGGITITSPTGNPTTAKVTGSGSVTANYAPNAPLPPVSILIIGLAIAPILLLRRRQHQ